MFRFTKARSPDETLSDLENFLRGNSDEPIEFLSRMVDDWRKISYEDLEAAIAAGKLDELIDWRNRYAKVVNEKFSPLWLLAIQTAASKATRGRITIDDSDFRVKDFLRTRGAELVTLLSDESKRAIAAIILHGQANMIPPKKIAQQIRPLIGLNARQAQANVNYRERIFNRLVEQGLPANAANSRADKAALKYASKQHRQRAETIVHTELARAYNQGAHEGILAAQRAGLMGVCEMVWSTAGTNRVCGRCLALKDTVVGHTNESGVTLPPLHPRCRCTIIYREVTNSGLFRPKPPPELNYKPVSEERYNQLIIPLKKMGVTIMRGDPDTERRLKLFEAQAITSGCDAVSFAQAVSVSAILEETYHIIQNRQGMNDDKEMNLRSILNEIDAKKYLLRIADKYGIPREEVEETKIQLAQYEEALKIYESERSDSDA